ncbi:MAG: hypothetical protein HY260_13030 [Chloroflexi bacterium]|nr:hypothetical protein [Chloroflexota bacterium]
MNEGIGRGAYAYPYCAEVAVERLRILEILRPELRHDFNSPLGLIKANLGMVETLAASLTQLVGTARPAGGGAAAADGAQSDAPGLDLILENLAPLVGGALAQTDRALRAADALVAFCAGDEASDRADVNQTVARALELVRGRLKYKYHVERRFASLPWARIAPRDLMHAVVVALLRAAASAPEQTTITAGTAVAEGGIVIEIEAATGTAAEHPGDPPPIPDLTLSALLLESSGGNLQMEEHAGGRRYALRLQCL